MNKARASGAFSVMTALWLTLSACTTNPATETHSLFDEAGNNDQDTTVVLCDDDLVETLVNRSVDDLIASGSDFKGLGHEGETLSERIKAFEAEQTEQFSVFFDCSEGNEGLNVLASQITDSPDDTDNPDRFRAIVTTLASERMDDVQGIYPLEDLIKAADTWKDHLLKVHEDELESVEFLFDDNEATRRVHDLIEDNYERLIISATRLELADLFNMENQVPNTSVPQFIQGFRKMVKDEVAKYVQELQEKVKLTGPQLQA